jgi:hypothetical protein
LKYYRLWVTAFLLKFIGSAWDASYHFKYLFEEYSIPHIVNFSGFALGAFLLVKEWRQQHYMDRFSRNLITIGYALFLIGIPLDFSYHIAYGIDLTTWSPTHFIYYIATDIMIIGVWRGFYNFKENGAISYNQYIHHQSIASKEILALISNPASQIFGGIPEWVYPIYSVAMVSLLTVFVIRLLGDYIIPVMATALYLLLRFVGKTIFLAVHYPTSYVPITLLFIPIFYLVFRREGWLAGLAGTVCYFLALFAINRFGLLITPPVKLWELIPVTIVGILVPIVSSLVKGISLREKNKQTA